MNKTKLIVFIADSVPSEDEIITADNCKVCYRNSKFIDTTTNAIEDCDFVAGKIPENYSHIPEWGNDTKKEEAPKAPAPPPVGTKIEWKPNA